MRNCYDGIFFNEICAEGTPSCDSYNQHVASLVRSYDVGNDKKLVVMNPGGVPVSCNIFQSADIVSVENAYDEQLLCPNVPNWRWLAVQGGGACTSTTMPSECQCVVTPAGSCVNPPTPSGCQCQYPPASPTSVGQAVFDRLLVFRQGAPPGGSPGFWYFAASSQAEYDAGELLPSWLEDFAVWAKALG